MFRVGKIKSQDRSDKRCVCGIPAEVIIENCCDPAGPHKNYKNNMIFCHKCFTLASVMIRMFSIEAEPADTLTLEVNRIRDQYPGDD